MKRPAAWASIGLGLLFFPGCFLAPTYHRPTVEAAPTFKEEPGTSTVNVPFKPAHPGADALPKGAWWEIFGDSQLNALEEKIATGNQNVKQAEAAYREARAVVTVNRSNYFPSVVAEPSAIRQHTSSNASRNNNQTNIGTTYNDFTLPVSASWEPDFWGQVTMQVRSAKAAAQASAAALQSMRLSMQGELASDYFSLATLDRRQKLFKDTLNGYDQSLQLTKIRYTGGIASQADVALAQTQLSSARAQMIDLGITRAQFEHAVAVLIGQSPSTFSLGAIDIHQPPPIIPVGVPSQLLERRPDIAQAERQVVAANEEIGVARTAFFPAISLTATGGFESNRLSNWIAMPSRIWTLGAQATQTLLDFGRTIGLAKEARANYDAAVAGYRQTVLAAFQEVEDNLAAERLLAEENVEQGEAVKAAETSLQLQSLRYQQGIVSELDLIVVQTTALQNEDADAQILGRQLNAAVALIRAIGGGWDDSRLPWSTMLASPADQKNTPLAPTATPNPPDVSNVKVPTAYTVPGYVAPNTPALLPALLPAVMPSTASLPSMPASTTTLPISAMPSSPTFSVSTTTMPSAVAPSTSSTFAMPH